MTHYITLDGGTTNTRLSLVSDGVIKSTKKLGVGSGKGAEGHALLKKSIADTIKLILSEENLTENDITAILCAGTITSEVGLHYVEHTYTPAGLSELKESAKKVFLSDISPIPFIFISGVKTAPTSLDNADMLRGEEAELMGIIELTGDKGPCVYALMGSHSKIVQTDSLGRIESFSTSLTGELLQSVAENTILRNSFDYKACRIRSEFLKKGYTYCLKKGIGEALFKARVLKNIFGEDEDNVYSFFVGAILCGDVESVRRKAPEKIVVGGNDFLKEAIAILLREYANTQTVVLPKDIVADCVSIGLVKIFEQ